MTIKQVVFILAFSFTIGSYACSCGVPIDILEKIENTPLIIKGRIVNIEVSELEPGNTIKCVTVEITEAYKGTKVNFIEIRTNPGESGDCGEHFTLGEEYLIWAHDEYLSQKNDGIYGTSICNYNGLASEHKAGVEILRQLKSEDKL